MNANCGDKALLKTHAFAHTGARAARFPQTHKSLYQVSNLAQPNIIDGLFIGSLQILI
jgi:hypothetical protein